MLRIKKEIKQRIGQLFERSLRLISGSIHVKIIVLYHRIVKNVPSGLHDPALVVRAETFEMHIKELMRFFRIVPLENVLESKEKYGNVCAITFDDGWVDNYEVAFPILKEYGIPATVFLPSALIGTNDGFWFEKVWNLANSAKAIGVEQMFIEYFNDLVPSWSPTAIETNHVAKLITSLKDFSANALDDLVIPAYKRLGVPPTDEVTILGWDQVTEMGEQGITFGSHGLRHFILNKVETNLKKREIFDSLEILNNKAIPVAPFFSFPNGDWDEESIYLVAKAGYRGAVTTKNGHNTSRTSPFLLRRIGLHENMSNTPGLFWFAVFRGILAGSKSESLNGKLRAV